MRQTGLLYYVFPSANHTRFEHSIGALYVANAILQAIYANSLTASSKKPPAVAPMANAQIGQAVDVTDLSTDQTETLFRLTRLAALVHDLGHGPFSHHFEAFAPQLLDVENICQSNPRLAFLGPALTANSGTELFEKPSTASRVAHEVMSGIFFVEISHELGLSLDDAQVVSAAILGRPDVCAGVPGAEFVALIHDIVASAPADADRMDYLERDSRAIGVNYGLYDRNRLLKSFLAYRDENGLRLGIKRSGSRAVENLLQARYEMLVQVYYHKTNRAVQLMLGQVADEARGLSSPMFQWSTLEGLLNTYEALSDDRFMRVLRGFDSEWNTNSAKISALTEAIYQRRLWKRVFEGQVHELDAAHYALGDSPHPVMSDRVDPKATKDLEAGARLLVRRNDGTYRLTIKPWKDESPIIAALADVQSKIGRIYLQSDDTTAAKDLRMRVWKTGVGVE